MDRMFLAKVTGFFLYMVFEHWLGKREVGSVIGIVVKSFQAIIEFIKSKKG